MIHPEASPVTLRVRGVPIGLAYGVENWFRAVEFVCDRLGRTETTPREAVWPTWDHVSAEGWPLRTIESLEIVDVVLCDDGFGSVHVRRPSPAFGSGISPFHSPAFPEPSLRDFAKGTTGNGDDAGALD